MIMLATETFVTPVSNPQPVLAILTTSDTSGKIRGNKKNFADIILTGQEMGFIVYVLPVNRLSLKRKQLKGYTFQPTKKQWIEQTFPFPDVIYNRIPFRYQEKANYVRNKLQACKNDPRVTIFNPSFFNKWELYRWLRRAKKTRTLVPHTKRLTGPGALEFMLNKYAYLYLKPESGKAGKGIMTIVKKSSGNLPYRLNIQDGKSSITYSSATYKKLWQRIKQECGIVPYIVQQGITLATYRNRKFDLRALVQKNVLGQWEVTGLGARIAGSTSITTHVPRGGSIEDPLKCLTHSFNSSQAHNIIQKASTSALTLAKKIELSSGDKLGEMSMDIGVDSKGSIWFFEANSKPMKFDEPHIRKKSLQRLFQYSQYLINK